jgi:class 3 adenylate cyclase
MAGVPTGTITFLFTDIEGSTRLWQDHPDAMRAALARHDGLLRAAIEARGGYVFSTAGDGFSAAFHSVQDGVAAALEAQQSLAAEQWGDAALRVRMALHCGEAEERSGDYFGPVLNEAARLMSVAHGGQVLMSSTVRDLIGEGLAGEARLIDLGQQRLKDVDRSIQVFQVTHPELVDVFPPLQTGVEVPHNLPSELTSFVGREHELAEVRALVDDCRLVTLTGAGGSGKTRLALKFATQVLEDFPDGAWFIDLAPIDDPALVPQAGASALQVREQPGRPIFDVLAERLHTRKALLVLDNCEHVLDAAAGFAADLLKRTEEGDLPGAAGDRW